MSLILEALKKAERQHRLGEVPSIGSSPMTDGAIPHRGRMILVVVVLALGMLLLGSYLGKPWQHPEAEPVTQVPSLQTLPVPQQSQMVPPSRAPTEFALKPEPEPTVVLPASQPQSVQQRAVEPASEVVATADPVPIEAEPKPESVSEPAPIPAPAPAREIKPPPPKQMSELPDGFVTNMPKLNIDIHSFDERPGRSYVLINMEKYHEGDYLAEGPLLTKILRDGVILEYMGERFILPIGNY